MWPHYTCTRNICHSPPGASPPAATPLALPSSPTLVPPDPLQPCAPPITPAHPPLWKVRRATTVLASAFLSAARGAEDDVPRVMYGALSATVAMLARGAPAAHPHTRMSSAQAASHLLARGHKRAAVSAATGVAPVSARDNLMSKGFTPYDHNLPSPLLVSMPFDPFTPAEVRAGVKQLRSIGAGPSGLRPPVLAAALVGAGVVEAAAKILTLLLRARPPWLFFTRPLVLQKPSKGLRVIEIPEPMQSLIEVLVLARCAPAPPLDVAALAVTTRARILRGEALVVADVVDGFNTLPHDRMREWASCRPESSMLVDAQLSLRCVVDEDGGWWTRDAGGPTGARTTCLAFCSELRRVLPPEADIYIDDVIVPLALWQAAQDAVQSLGLAFGANKTCGFNIPLDSPFAQLLPTHDDNTHILGVPLSGESRRIERLHRVCGSMDAHDGLTMTVGDLYSSLSFDMATSVNNEAVASLVAAASAKAQITPDMLPLCPDQASDASVLSLITRMLVNKTPHAWELFDQGAGWFARAKEVLSSRHFATNSDTQTVSSPQSVPLLEPPKRILSHLAKASRRAQDRHSVASGVPSPQSNVITKLLLAGGERPHLTDGMTTTAAALRSDDQTALVDAAGSNVCPLCSKQINAHHPLLCDTINHRGTAHDNLVRRLAGQASKNPSITVRANKAHQGPNGREGRFRPDIAIEETSQLFEIKTLNAEAHGPRLHQDFIRVAIDARDKYMRNIQRLPYVIAASTDGFLPKEGFRALDQLTNAANLDMPIVGPRLMLIAGLALCESAAGAYEAWYSEVRSAAPVDRPPLQ